MDIRKIKQIDQLIRIKQTGSPKQLANKIECSERMVFKYLKYMREELTAPLSYNRSKETYCYENEGRLCLAGFQAKDI